MSVHGGFPLPMCAKHPDTRYQYVAPTPGGSGGGVTCPKCRQERETAALEERAAARCAAPAVTQIPVGQASAGAQRTVREAEFDAWCEGKLGAAWHEFLDGFGVAPTEPFPAP